MLWLRVIYRDPINISDPVPVPPKTHMSILRQFQSYDGKHDERDMTVWVTHGQALLMDISALDLERIETSQVRMRWWLEGHLE